MQVVDVNGNMFGYDFLEVIGINGKPKTIGGGGGSTAWGSITGTLSAQTDLQSALNAKFDDPTGTSSQYIDGTGALQTFPTLTSADKMVTVGRNSTGSTLYKGTIIYILGSTGNRPNYVKAQANAEATSAGTFGVILADIPNNSDGQAVTIGTVDSLDTRSTATHPFTTDTLADGDTIYLSPTVAGYVTNVKPHAPNHIVYIGKVVRTSPTNGTIVYRIQNGYELDEIHDVQIISVANNDLLQYDSATFLWKNRSLSAAGIQPALGYTPVPTTRTISTTSPLSGGGDLSADRTLVISQANAITNGYLSSTDWNTFNDKQTLLISGTNIKTLNSTSLLGSGNIAVEPTITAGTTAQYWRGDKTWQTFPTIPTVTPSALTKVDDTNVTLTLGGSPSTALLQATSLTLGWTGTLADSRIASAATWNAKQNALVSGTNIKTVNSTSLLGSGDVSVGVTSVTGTSPISSSGGAAPAISIATANTSTTGALTSTDWNTFNGKQNALTLTTTGTSGAATLVGSTLNIPQYSGGGGGTNNLKFTSLQLTNGTNVTNTITDTITYSVLIPANTFTTQAFFDFSSRITKTGTTQTWNVRLYKNTSNSLTGATLIATLGSAISSTFSYTQNLRFFRVSSSTLTFFQATIASAGDSVNQANIEGTTTFNLAVDNYFLLAVSQGAANADVIRGVMCKVLGYE